MKDLIVEGYALLWDVEYNFGDYIERIAPSALRGANMKDVRFLQDHNMSLIHGRSTAGTLRLEIDKTGLFFVASLPNGPSGLELYDLIERKDIFQCSWGFISHISKGSEWTSTKNGTPIRTIKEVHSVLDVTVTAFPANPHTKTWTRRGATRNESMEGKQDVAFVDYDPLTDTSTPQARAIEYRASFKAGAQPQYECASLAIDNEVRARLFEHARQFCGGTQKQEAKDPKELLKEIEAKRDKYRQEYDDFLRREKAKEYSRLSDAEKLAYTREAARKSNELAEKYKGKRPITYIDGVQY